MSFETICPICKYLIRVNELIGKEIVCPECGWRFPTELADIFYSNEE